MSRPTRSDQLANPQFAADLFSQQLWCWGRDILRTGGNWLIDVGFERIPPPADRAACPSVYILELAQARRVLLRGFGVIYSDAELGSIFLSRNVFSPQYTHLASIGRLPWTIDDLPILRTPAPSQRESCGALVLGLIHWITRYEQTIIEQLGLRYRQSTLTEWDNGSRPAIPAEQMVRAWQSISEHATTVFYRTAPLALSVSS
ncbi:MAG: hypothetical protein AAGH88_15305 [Planctomycetota bacterium]